MNRIITLGIITCSLTIGAISACQSTEEVAEINPSTEEVVEVKLIDNIDEPRGYCLDVAGGRGTKAPIEKGLQAHTCYDYTC